MNNCNRKNYKLIEKATKGSSFIFCETVFFPLMEAGK